MRYLIAVLTVIALAGLTAPAGWTQEEDQGPLGKAVDGREAGQDEGAKPPSEPGTGKAPDKPSGGSSTKEREDEAVRALMGEADKPAKKPAEDDKPASATRSNASGTGSATSGSTATRSSSSGSRSRSTRSGAADTGDATVPEVPADAGELPTAAETPAAPADDLTLTPAPTTTTPDYNNYRTPAPEPAAPEVPGNEMDNAAAPGAAQPPTSTGASAIIIGLIVLAILLVALAALVGVMAAQRARPGAGEEAAGAAAVTGGWAYLTASNAPNISLQKAAFVMGSSAACDLRLADPKASPQHARIDRTEDGYILTDLGSANATWLNDQRIASPVSLRPGDVIRMGDIEVTFELYVG